MFTEHSRTRTAGDEKKQCSSFDGRDRGTIYRGLLLVARGRRRAQQLRGCVHLRPLRGCRSDGGAGRPPTPTATPVNRNCRRPRAKNK